MVAVLIRYVAILSIPNARNLGGRAIMPTDDKAEVEVLFVPLWPEAAQALGFKSKTATYRAAAAGHIVLPRPPWTYCPSVP
jgi:hypothetical protein